MEKLELDRPAQVQKIPSHTQIYEKEGWSYEIADQYFLNWQVNGESYSKRISFELAQILVSSGLTYRN